MAKRHDLRRKLKAADRRRSRRREAETTSASSPAVQTRAADRVDVVGLTVAVILEFAATDSSVHDVAVVAAMRNCLRGGVPSADQAQRLASQIDEISTQPGVTQRAYRDALTQLLSLAASHEHKETRDAFLQYLRLLSDHL